MGTSPLGTLAKAPVPARAACSEQFCLPGRCFFLLLPRLIDAGGMTCPGSLPRPAVCVSCRSFQRWEKGKVSFSLADSAWPSPAPFHCFGLVTSLCFSKGSVNGSPARVSGSGLLVTAGKMQKNHLETHFLPWNSSYYDK